MKRVFTFVLSLALVFVIPFSAIAGGLPEGTTAVSYTHLSLGRCYTYAKIESPCFPALRRLAAG